MALKLPNRFILFFILLAMILVGSKLLEIYNVSRLINQLKYEKLHTRLYAARKLGNLGNSRAVEPLINCLKEEPAALRSISADALSKIGDRKAVEPLMDCLKDSIAMVRHSAVDALIEIGDSRAVEPLIICLHDIDPYVRSSAVNAFRKFVDKRALEPLIDCLKDKQMDVRQSAAEALGKIGDAKAVEPLITCLKTPDLKVQFSASDALAAIGKQSVESLIFCLKDTNSDVIRVAAYALGQIGDKNAIPYLVSSLPEWDINKDICSALDSLAWTPHSEAENVYYWISKKDKTHLNANWEQTKRVLLIDTKSGVRRKIQNAVFTLISLGREEIINELINVLDSRGDWIMAEIYLNCGNNRLSQAAGSWALKRGYNIKSGSGANEAAWGRW